MTKKTFVKLSTAILVMSIAGLGFANKYEVRYFNSGSFSGIPVVPETTYRDTSLSVGTFNAALLDIKMLGKKFEPTPLSNKRLRLMPEQIKELHLDVLGVQEIYQEKDKVYLITELKNHYPFAVYFKKVRSNGIGLNNGLLFLSKKPILSATFKLYDRNPIGEKIMADKGILSIDILNGNDTISITNTHTTVGGGVYHTESNKANSIRNKQLWQTIATARSSKAALQIILGDFNAGPGVSEVNYQLMLDSGFVDSYSLLCKEDCNDITWDPLNKLNSTGHFPDSPPQRIDNIFVYQRKGAKAPLRALNGGVVLNEEVLIEESGTFPISDHYGYFVEIEL